MSGLDSGKMGFIRSKSPEDSKTAKDTTQSKIPGLYSGPEVPIGSNIDGGSKTT
jgi:hypothetical protein